MRYDPIRESTEKANSIFGIEGAMIFCLGRDCTEEQNEGIFKKSIQYFKRGVIINVFMGNRQRYEKS